MGSLSPQVDLVMRERLHLISYISVTGPAGYQSYSKKTLISKTDATTG